MSLKQLWKNLNDLCNTNNHTSKDKLKINKLVMDDKNFSSDIDISNSLNNYFCNVGSNLVALLPKSSVDHYFYMKNHCNNSIFCEPITVSELVNLIQSMKVKRSCGPDNVDPLFVKENCFLLAEPLVYVYNLSLMQGIVPDNMKIAKVIPLYKKGDHCLPSNYRPISLLNFFSKLLEKLVHNRVYNFLNKNNVFYELQFGFRKQHSTALALLDVVDNCNINLAKNNKILGIFFDLQKAFDTVDHVILLSKLYNYGIRGILYSWFESYLFNRKQYTVLNNCCSDVGNISHGVPQGSVLGPLLFLIYINDIHETVPDNQLKLFADDTNLFLYGPDLKELESRANCYISAMYTWLLANKLSLNIDKTCHIVFPKQKSVDSYNSHLSVGNKKIFRVTNCKYLGLIIDESLKWELHIDYVYKKIIKYTSIFYKLRRSLSQNCLKKLYFAFVHPHLLYGIEVYGAATNSALDKLYKLNSKILRVLQCKTIRETPVVALYKQYNTLPIYFLYRKQLLIFVHKCIYHPSLIPVVFHACFSSNESVHSHNTRKKNDLHLFGVNNYSYAQSSISFHGSKLWNCLPPDLKNNCSISVFNNNLNRFYADHYQLCD
jgi:hypothetical protein